MIPDAGQRAAVEPLFAVGDWAEPGGWDLLLPARATAPLEVGGRVG